MSVFRNIKIELVILFIITLNVFISFNLDLSIYNYFKIFNNSMKAVYLKDFFTNITEVGSSGWYFGICVFGFFILYFNKKLKIINIKNTNKKINFFVSSFVYILIAGIITQICKHVVGRPRPNYTDFEDGFGFNFFTIDSNYHSFPSGHSSTIFMVCLILCAILPKLKYFFFLLASVVALSRVVVGAHFFTDIVAGGLLSLIVFKSLNFFLNKNYKNYVFSEILFSKNSQVYYFVIFLFSCGLFITVGPTLDLYVAGLFYIGESQFSLQSVDFLSKIFRKFLLPLLIFYILILPIFSRFIRIHKVYFGYKFSIKEIFLIWVTQILSILIFINLILKDLWGRARPGDITHFGGKEMFTPWFELSSACDSNCSFVSGDASVGFSIIVLYFITKNILFFYLSIMFGVLLGFIRIIAGGHFLSDILFAGIFILIINLLIFKLYKKYYDK